MKIKRLSLRSRIFLAMLVIVLFATFLIVSIVIYLNKEQGLDYHNKRLLRKEHTIKAIINNELERTTYPVTTKDIPFIFRDQIFKIKDINNLEIVIYDLNGKLLSTSMPTFSNDTTDYSLSKEIIEKLNNSVNKRYLKEKKKNRNTIQSSYTFINDAQFKPIGILGIPYLQDNSEQERDLHIFLNFLLYAYALILIITGLFAFWVSKYITKSIKQVSDKISKTVLGSKNEKVTATNASIEIATLVNSYNQMVDKLEKSAIKLAKSEREEAWREMAKQVAHEIKNPLTPMRLTVQSFQMRFNPNDKNYKEKLAEFSKTMITQIDTLTSIASAFSNFAKMPTQQKESLNVIEVVKNATEIFTENYIEFHSKEENIIALLDKTQLIRIITNLIKNAVQALSNTKDKLIEVCVKKQGNQVLITVKDNGKGIENEHKKHIFEPKFTTKSSGMGLGLAMIKNIIETYKGKITFTSEINKGTTFYITLPLK